MIARKSAGSSSAFALDEASRAACAGVSAGLQRTGFAARYEAPEKFHVTLAFLGNVGAHQYEAIATALDGVAAQTAPLHTNAR